MAQRSTHCQPRYGGDTVATVLIKKLSMFGNMDTVSLNRACSVFNGLTAASLGSHSTEQTENVPACTHKGNRISCTKTIYPCISRVAGKWFGLPADLGTTADGTLDWLPASRRAVHVDPKVFTSNFTSIGNSESSMVFRMQAKQGHSNSTKDVSVEIDRNPNFLTVRLTWNKIKCHPYLEQHSRRSRVALHHSYNINNDVVVLACVNRNRWIVFVWQSLVGWF